MAGLLDRLFALDPLAVDPQLGAAAVNPGLPLLAGFVREQDVFALLLHAGDSLVVTKLDRLARSTRHLGKIVETLKEKSADLQIIDLGIDTSTLTGALVLNLLGSVAEFERAMMLERQREGIAKAKAEGRYKGRKPTARAKTDDVLAMKKDGKGPTQIASALGIGRASVYRILSAATG